MINLTYYGRVVPASSATIANSEVKMLNVKALQPILAIQVVLEQYILADYLRRADNPKAGNVLAAIAERLDNSLPKRIGNTIFADAYNIGKEYCELMRKGMYTSIDAQQLLDIFTSPLLEDEVTDDNIYTATIAKQGPEFLYVWLNITTSYVPASVKEQPGTEPALFNAPLLIPSLVPGKRLGTDGFNGDDEYVTTIDFSYNTEISSSFNMFGSNRTGLGNLLARYNLAKNHLGNIAGLLSNFCLERNRYIMTNSGTNGNCVPCTIQDVCFDLVTSAGSHDATARSSLASNLSNANKMRLETSLTLLAQMAKSNHLGRIHNVEDSSMKFVITELMSRCGASAQLVNYFTKPVQAITMAEARAFDSSIWADLIDSRLSHISGMEALDEEVDDTEDEDTSDDTEQEDTASDKPSEDAADEDDNEADTDEEQDDDSSDDSAEDEDKGEPGKVDHRPDIDPKLMLLELASPVEALSDYLYRELVSRRISYILKNPPKNADPEVLHFLKAWKSQWLYLVSIPTIRDFISRITIRLS